MSQARAVRPRTSGVLLAVGLLTVVVDGGLLAKYVADDGVLENVVALDERLPPSRKAVALVDYIETHVPRIPTTDASFLPGLSFLRPTARQVLEKGGDCADRSRLLIELLKREGVNASKVALYDREGIPRHAVVEVETEQGAMAIDALFGMYFPKPGGGYYSVEDIRKNESTLADRVRELSLTRPVIATYPLELYTYVAPRSINWDKSPVMRQLYRMLQAVMGPKVDDLRRPGIVEDPVLMVLAGLGGGQMVLLVGGLVVRRRGLRSSRRTADV